MLAVTIFTLNVWGIPYVSKNRRERMTAIASHLAAKRYDVVCLQEVWDKKDYDMIRDKLTDVMPYSHYFYSGVFGSGVCVFSRWPIEEVFFHAWPLNGYVHMVHHGDWFGGKGVGLCKINCNDVIVNVYTAHLHAEYSTDDIYLAHRVLQAFNTAEFIKLTSSNADLIILAGDLNIQPNDLAFRIICETGILIDSCTNVESSNANDDEKASLSVKLGTNERSGNSYTSPTEALLHPEGKRIDYILYHTGSNYIAKVKNYSLPLPNNVPGYEFSYSDHDAVTTELEITKSLKPNQDWIPPKEYFLTLGNAISVCEDAIITLQHSAKRYLIFALSLFILLISTVGMAERTIIDLPRLLVVVLMFYFIFMGTLWNCMEYNGLLAGKHAMEIIHRNLATYHLDDILNPNVNS